MTKITIFSGFLGAGKTTLIKKLIEEAYQGEKLVLIENEFGEIGIDGGFLKEAGIEVTEMNSGCICCSLVGDFGKALEKVLKEYHPTRILIEPSGVGKLSDVINAVKNLKADVELDAFVTVADVNKVRLYTKNFGEFYNNQIENASAIVLSRTDAVDDARLQGAIALLRERNPKAPIVTTPWSQLKADQLLEAMEHRDEMKEEVLEQVRRDREHHHEHGEHCGCGHHEHPHEHHYEHGEHCDCGHHEHPHEHHHEHGEHCGCGHDHAHGHHHADEVFSSWGLETANRYTMQEVRAKLEALDSGEYGAVLRAKGIVPSEDGTWIHFDYVPGEADVRTGGADYTGRLCVIGAQLNEPALEKLFGKEA